MPDIRMEEKELALKQISNGTVGGENNTLAEKVTKY